ncbi:hypothetical protein GCM10009083_26180 [Halopseudomonas pertucinogena]|uniref:Uncharacterized protein n=1 Tax=Halopseudomonas pertucinogena TaxID=86175 RepID=A0ABQ2CS95_9GAMM|nr:hypothetical protein GCM10009083_26180 [Halopseudomonas pertucinogena]
MGTASEQGKYCCRSSQNILRNRHLSILIMAIGMRPSAVPGQSGKYTAKAASGKIANHSSDKTPHPSPPTAATEFNDKAWTKGQSEGIMPRLRTRSSVG